MSTTFRRYAPDQSLLLPPLPPDVREWLPEGHLAHHVSDLVEGAALFRRMLSPAFIRGYTYGRALVGTLWQGTASGQRLHSLVSGSRSV